MQQNLMRRWSIREWVEKAAGAEVAEYKTDSERMFADYMVQNGVPDWEYEPEYERKSKHPDFLVRHAGETLFFEIKERAPETVSAGDGHYNPVAGLRSAIKKAQKKFKEFAEYSCSLVFMDMSGPGILEDPDFVFAAMLGDLGFTFPVGPSVTAENATGQNVFLPKGWKMVNYKRSEFQNTRMSSVIILREDRLKNREFEATFESAVCEQERKEGRTLTPREKAILTWNLGLDLNPVYERVNRLVIHNNPGAQQLLPQDLFRGDFDERYEWDGQETRRVFTGARLDEIESGFVGGDSP